MERIKAAAYELTFHKPKLPQGECTLAFLADFHDGGDEVIGQVLDQIKAMAPDLVLIGGDLPLALPGRSHEQAMKLVEALADACPCVYAYGNHEYRMCIYPETYGDEGSDLEAGILNEGVRLLRNTSAHLEAGGLPLTITGYELPADRYAKFRRVSLDREDMVRDIQTPEPERLSILLAHNPKFGDTYLEWGADLTLCGHMHGGCVRIWGKPLISTDFTLFPRYGYGHKQKGDRHIITTSGIGDHTLKLRLFNPREVVCLKIRNTC